MNDEKILLFPREIHALALLIDSIAQHKKRIETLNKKYLEALHGDENKVMAQNILDEIHFSKGIILGYKNCKNLIIKQATAINMEDN